MAISSAQLNELRERQNSLKKELDGAYAKIAQERERIEKENNEKLEGLLRESRERLAEREYELHGEYRRLLDAGMSAQERALSENLRALQERYDRVSAEVNEAVAEERKRTEAVMLEQRRFEEAYLKHRELARSAAEKSAAQAEEAFGQLSEQPVEWFRRGRLSIYRAQLAELKRLFGMELYESAAAVGDNMLLSIRLELLECEEMLRRWLRYYRVLRGALEDERRLIYEKALELPAELEKFRAAHSEEVNGGYMSVELADRWTDGGYGRLCEGYRNDFALLDLFRDGSGELVADEKDLRGIMMKDPDEGVNYRETALYRGVTEVLRNYDGARRLLEQMRGRMSAFEQRLVLAGETVKTLADGNGYILCDLPPFGAEGETGTFAMTFADGNNVHTADVIIVPVRRYSDGGWINHAVWFYSEGTGEKTVSALERSLAEVFVKERRISLRRDVMRVNQTRGERVNLARGEMQLMQELRMN